MLTDTARSSAATTALLATALDPTLTYRANISKPPHDGDTLYADVSMGPLTLASLGLDVVARDIKIRLNGINAWELSTEAGKAARDVLVALLPVGTPITLRHVTAYKYGFELVANVVVGDIPDLSTYLMDNQWAAPWDGNGKASDHLPPWPRNA